MKFLKLKFALLASMLFALVGSSNAQFDDLYYNPETDYVAVQTTSRDYDQPQEQRYSDPAPANQYNDYDDQYANRMDDYDFHYSSRIRRFNRPMGGGFGFYDPFYVDRFHYDPFYQPGVSIYVNTGWNAFSPWRHRPWGYNRRGFGWGGGFGSPWCPTPRMGFGNPYAFNGMGMGFVRPMGFGMSPWGMNPYGGWGNTMIINNYYGGGTGLAGSDPWAMDNSYNRFSRIENPQREVRSVSYGPRTIGSSRTSGTTTGRTRDGLSSGRSNYDQYPASRRQASDGSSTTGRRAEATDQRAVDPARRVDGRNTTSPREATGRSSEATRSSREQNARSQPQQTRRSLFNNSSRNSNSRSTSPRSSSPSRSSGVNRSSRSSSRSSGVNRSSRSSSRSSGVNRSSRGSSRSSGVNRSSRGSSRSSGVNRSSRSSSRSSGVNRSSRSSSRSSGVRSSGSSSRSSSGRSSRGGGRG